MRISDSKKGIDPKIGKALIKKLGIKDVAGAFNSNFVGKEEITFADVTISDKVGNVWNVSVKEDQDYIDMRMEGIDYVKDCLHFDFVGILSVVLNEIRNCAERAVKHKNKKIYTEEIRDFLFGFRNQITSAISSIINGNEVFKRNMVWYSLSGIPKYQGRPPSANYIATKSGIHEIHTADEKYITKCLKASDIIFDVSPNRKGKCMYNKVMPRILKEGMEIKPPIRIARNLEKKMNLIIASLQSMENDLEEVKGFANITTNSKIKLV